MCSDNVAIRVNNLSKCHHIYNQPHERLLQMLFQGRKKFYQEFWALRDVSIEIMRGETVAIVGKNGSGKSTLLQLISGTLNPSSGSVDVFGRVAALLELGSGFNPEFTGRENVLMSCSLLGLSNHESAERFDEIAAFADIGDFIEQPVKTYSSGMQLRLAFAVNVVVKAEILIIDEALSVGDMQFQAKCMTALKRIQQEGTTILFVSHDLNAVKSLCSKAVYLEKGKMIANGAAIEVAEQYIRDIREEMNARYTSQSKKNELQKNLGVNNQTESFTSKSNLFFVSSDEFDERVRLFRYGSGGVQIRYVALLDMDGSPLNVISFNQEVLIRVYFEAMSERHVSVNVNILDSKKINIVGCDFPLADRPFLKATAGSKYIAEFTFKLPLKEGVYSVQAHISSPVVLNHTAEYLDVVNEAVIFEVSTWDKARVWSCVHVFPKLELFQVQDTAP